ncbi:amino acid ABC transporter permease [Falsiroseomonas sp. CW058]|uniref:amino acid ABC transporter permease n=1 Tax=Falsiroseomonas sp. CW058 TaxID=3388664 RepID=UPI003D31FBFB
MPDGGLPRRTLPAPARGGWRRWTGGLFDSVPNALVSAALLWLLARAGMGFWDWAVTRASLDAPNAEACARAGGACWSFLADRWRLILFGPYPYAQQWRPALALVLFVGLIAATAAPASWRARGRVRALALAWLAGVPLAGTLMWGGVAGLPVVPSRLWGGLPLTVMLASVGVALAFVLALGLALGRVSDMPAIRLLSTLYIEFFRGVPLIALLFLAAILFPYLVPPDWTMDTLLRAQLAFALFFAAYMAEAVRGGLQAIPRGQYLAADSLGMTYWQARRRIILPQALRLVIPSLVNIFIAAFKDTSLVVVISMLDLLGAANASTAQAQWWGLYIEPYLFIAAIYLAFCAAMSAYSRGLERRLGVGVR